MSQLTITGAVRVQYGGASTSFSLVDAYVTTGSHFTFDTVTINTSSQIIDQGDNQSNRYNFFANLNTTGSVSISINSTASYAAIIGPGLLAILPNSGSCVLYAYALNQPVVLSYLCIEN